MLDANTLIGQKIGRYLVEEHIAQGGMANVYRATDTDLDRQVALKIMLPELARDKQFVDRFRREAQAVARLNHPNIVQVYGTDLTPSQQPYIAMQFINGRSLAEILQKLAEKRQTIPIPDVLLMVRQIADALHVSHEAGIIHRDIKPSNILIRPDRTPVLVDLGIAALDSSHTRLTHTGNLLGTPHYMSPEQIKGEQVDGRSDIYSLGVILYELLSGQLPFNMPSTMAVMHSHVYEEPPPIEQLQSDLPTDIRRLVHTCLQKDPGQRLTAVELLHALDHIMGDTGRPLHLPNPPLPPATPPTRPKWLYAAGGIAALLLLLFGAFQFGLFSQEPETAVPAMAQGVVATLEASDDSTAEEPTPLPTSTLLPTVAPTVPAATDTPAPTATPTASPTALPISPFGPETIVLAQSPGGTPIEVVRFGNGPKKLLFVGGIHAGYAPSTASLANQLITYLEENPQEVPANATVYIVPMLNPDSDIAFGEIEGRLNDNGVDLNRNWDCQWKQDANVLGVLVRGSGGTAPFSEPEVQGLMAFIVEQQPAAVVFWAARASRGLTSPGSCSTQTAVSGTLAQTYGNAANYEIGDFEQLFNQILNGDATNWLDQEGIPAISVLIKDYSRVDWDDNLAGIRAVIRRFGS
ncbi:MAG: protein kinase [Chloroflexota bacterium]